MKIITQSVLALVVVVSAQVNDSPRRSTNEPIDLTETSSRQPYRQGIPGFSSAVPVFALPLRVTVQSMNRTTSTPEATTVIVSLENVSAEAYELPAGTNPASIIEKDTNRSRRMITFSLRQLGQHGDGQLHTVGLAAGSPSVENSMRILRPHERIAVRLNVNDSLLAADPNQSTVPVELSCNEVDFADHQFAIRRISKHLVVDFSLQLQPSH